MMMHKKKIVAMLGFCILMLVSCSNEKQDDAQIQRDIDAKLTYYDEDVWYVEDHLLDGRSYGGEIEKYGFELKESHMKALPIEKTLLKQTSAIEYLDGKLYVLDPEKNEIAVLDMEGNRLQTHGKLGSAPGEFESPIDLFYHESKEEWYVLDSGNHRVQILDKNLNFKREISLKLMEIYAKEEYQSVAVDQNQNMYIF